MPGVVELRDTRGAQRLRRELVDISDLAAGAGSSKELIRRVESFNRFARRIALEWNRETRPTVDASVQLMSVGIPVKLPLPEPLTRREVLAAGRLEHDRDCGELAAPGERLAEVG